MKLPAFVRLLERQIVRTPSLHWWQSAGPIIPKTVQRSPPFGSPFGLYWGGAPIRSLFKNFKLNSDLLQGNLQWEFDGRPATADGTVCQQFGVFSWGENGATQPREEANWRVAVSSAAQVVNSFSNRQVQSSVSPWLNVIALQTSGHATAARWNGSAGTIRMCHDIFFGHCWIYLTLCPISSYRSGGLSQRLVQSLWPYYRLLRRLQGGDDRGRLYGGVWVAREERR